MNRSFRALGAWAFCALLVLTVACGGGVDSASYGKIKNGMTVEEVHDILGEPDETGGVGIAGASAAVHTWKDGDKTITVNFLNEKVQTKAKTGF